jgi:hypothetical protein
VDKGRGRLNDTLAVGPDSLREHLESAQKSLLFGKPFRPSVESPILPTPAGSEGFVSSTRGPAVQGEVLPRFPGTAMPQGTSDEYYEAVIRSRDNTRRKQI